MLLPLGILALTPAAFAGQVVLTWADNSSNESGFQIERALGDLIFTQVASVGSNVTTYTDTTVLPSTLYYYRVRAYNSAGSSAYSNTTSALTSITGVLNTSPTISSVANQSVVTGSSTGTLAFTIGDLETAATSLAINGVSSNTTLVPAGNIVFGGSGANRTVTVTPASGQTGSTTITLTVNDGSLTATTSFVVTVTAASSGTTSGLVAAYSFNEGTGTTVTDLSGNGNNGTISGATWTTGRYGSALNFNGSTDVVSIPSSSSLSPTTALTLEAWAYPTAIQSDWRILAHKSGYAYYLLASSANGPLWPAAGGMFGGANANAYASSGLAVNTWTHLAMTYDGSTVRMFVNGVQVSSAPASGTVLTNSNALTIGNNIPNSQAFLGRIDELRVYNRALSAAEIQGDMATALGGAAANTAPTISPIAGQSTTTGVATSALAFTVGDSQTAASSLTVTAASSNTTLVPTANVALGGSGANRTVTVTPVSGQTGSANITLTVSDGSLTASTTFALTVNAAANTAPTISSITSQSVNEDSVTGALAFTVGDSQTAASSLVVTGTSSNTTLVPNSNIVLGGSGANRTVTLTPAANQSGSTTITLNVTDGSLSTTTSFTLTVNAVNDAPTISSIAAQSIAANTATSALAFTVGDSETSAASLTVTGASSNTALVPATNIVFGGSGASRTVTVTPASGQSGTATITVTVSDGSLTTSTSFAVTVTAAANTAPTISSISNTTINEDASTGALAFTVGDAQTAAGSLAVTASSSNSTLLPAGSIVLGGSGANRTLTLTPAANQNGSATVTLTVSDGSLTASKSFTLTVNAVNDTPTISSVSNQSISSGGNTGALAFTVSDADTATTSLVVTGTSSNTTLVPNANIVLGGSGANRTVTVTPASGQSGSANITLTVSDGSLTASTTFTVTVAAPVSTTQSFSKTTAISIPSYGAANPYPSTIAVSGMSGTISAVTVKLNNFTHSSPADVDVLLVSPTGQKLLLMSDAGGSSTNNVTLTFSGTATASLPSSGRLNSGTYLPTNYDTTTDTFSSPAPAAPYASSLSTFNGQSANGTWSLYVRDDRLGSSGSFAGGWVLTITTTTTSGTSAATVEAMSTDASVQYTSVTEKSATTTIAPNDPILNVTSGISSTTDASNSRLLAFAAPANVTTASPLNSSFVISGSGSRTVLLRGVGPALASFGITNPLPKPILRLYDSKGQLMFETGAWGGSALIADAITRLGKFPLAADSADAAMLVTLTPGTYTAQVADGSGQGGMALVEITDAGDDISAVNIHLTSANARGTVGSSSSTLVSALTVGGTAPRRLLIRGIGPELAKSGVTAPLANPIVEVYDSQNVLLARNDDWQSPITVTLAQPAASASALSSSLTALGLTLSDGSRDAAVIVTLAPGVYSVQVSSATSTAGTAALEVYELP